MKKWLLLLAPATLIVVLLGYVLGSHAIPQSVQDNLANAAVGVDTSGLPDDTVAGAIPEAPTNAQAAASPLDNASVPTAENEAAPVRATSDPSDDADAAAQARDEIAAAVRRATLRALDGGEPAHWHKDGIAGDIVVSEPQDDGSGGQCRTVTATIDTDDDQRQSGDHVWCQAADGGDWAPR